jgi:hypothetical protein
MLPVPIMAADADSGSVVAAQAGSRVEAATARKRALVFMIRL